MYDQQGTDNRVVFLFTLRRDIRGGLASLAPVKRLQTVVVARGLTQVVNLFMKVCKLDLY
jgi:hypothetical protein